MKMDKKKKKKGSLPERFALVCTLTPSVQLTDNEVMHIY
jgi:hypothetical protein